MKLKELKDSLNSRFNSDWDDTEVLLRFQANEESDFDCLAFVGVTTNSEAIILGSNQEALKMIAEGKLGKKNS